MTPVNSEVHTAEKEMKELGYQVKKKIESNKKWLRGNKDEGS